MQTPKWVLWARNQFGIVYVAASAGYAAAIAAGWTPLDWVQWTAAGVLAAGGIILYQNVSPATPAVTALPKEARRF